MTPEEDLTPGERNIRQVLLSLTPEQRAELRQELEAMTDTPADREMKRFQIAHDEALAIKRAEGLHYELGAKGPDGRYKLSPGYQARMAEYDRQEAFIAQAEASEVTDDATCAAEAVLERPHKGWRWKISEWFRAKPKS